MRHQRRKKRHRAQIKKGSPILQSIHLTKSQKESIGRRPSEPGALERQESFFPTDDQPSLTFPSPLSQTIIRSGHPCGTVPSAMWLEFSRDLPRHKATRLSISVTAGKYAGNDR